MARSPTDATRFTATGPHISSKPSASSTNFASNSSTFNPSATGTSSRIDFGTAPANESAQQKIARLRAAAALARRGKETQFDAVVRVGRVWADRAHRATALGLIGLTVVAGVVATAGITDMIMHNRRRRSEWLAEQQHKSAIDLMEAKKALARGVASEDQVLLINRERAASEAAEARKNRPGIFKRIGSSIFGDLSKEEQKGGKLGAAAASAVETTKAAVEPLKEQLLGENEDRGVLRAAEEKVESDRRQVEKVEEVLKPFGGPLDRQAQHTVDVFSSRANSWTSWITGR